MYPENLIVSTKLTPPRPQKYTLPRPRLTQRLLDALNHRLTIIQAGTGYGKSTALAALVEEDTPIIWYQLDAKDTDPQLFLLYLLHGFARQFPPFSQMPIALLEEVGKNPASLGWTAVVDSLINEITAVLKQPAILILDDVHQLDNASETIRILDRFISQAPPDLHIILSSRYPLTLPSLVTWRVKGNALEIGQNELAFTPPEIDNLFRNQYGYALTLEQASLLVSRIEGWPIALHLIWQQLQRDGGASLPDALGQLSGSAGDLLTYLTQEVLAQQPEDVQQFLRVTAVLREMTAVNCDMIRNAHDSQIILDYLLEKGLFIVNLGNGHMRYHHLFRTLLCNKLSTPEAQAIHARAAQTYREQGEIEEAIVHLLAAQAFAEAANLLDLFGRRMVRTGRLNSLADWLRALPPDVLAQHPPLFVYMGDVARLHSRFDEALNWYQQAEQQSRRAGNIKGLGQSLRGQARLYLDTVNPTQAERLLQEALRLADGQDDRESRARLLELLAENLLNQGRAKAAAEYQTQARALREEGPGPAELPLRMLLRTGRLDQARQLLEAQVEKEKQAPVLRPRAHRETLLLLSLVLAFQGEQEAAYETAVAGRQRGEALDSQFITAVGLMRQGHAWLLLKNNNGYKEAAHCFEEAIKLSESLEVPRLKVEAYWGLCQVYGFGGDLTTAAKIAQQGIDIAHQAGDEWIVAGIQLVLGAGHTLEASYSQATRLLSQASSGFHECGDTFGEAMS
ncbi:MAG: tetratricopeptide repeat protein, partial [Chloroflexi bacterium]|nr:tetratricopeptide repeat protein [Chloroflexota bacterium]